MISLKRIITLTIALFMLWNVSAQELIEYVNKNASVVAMINLKQIKTKADFDELIKLPFVKEMDKKIAKDISRNLIEENTPYYLNLSKYGINVNSNSYFYFVSGKEMYSGALIVSINDKNKFTEFVKIFTKDKEGEKIKSKDSYLQTNKRDFYIIWNNNIAVFMSATINPAQKEAIEKQVKKQLGYDDKIEVTEEITEEVTEEEGLRKPSYTDIYELKHKKIDSIQKNWFKNNTANFIKHRGINSYAKNTDFNNYTKSNPDAALVVDYGLFSDMYFNAFKNIYPKQFRKLASADLIQSFTKDMKMFIKFNFSKDDVTFNFDIKLSEKVNEVFAEVKKKSINKDFLKYMKKDMMGYYAFGLDVKGYSEGTKELLQENLTEIPKYGKIAVGVIDLLDIIIDEDAIYELFTGDVVFGINGVKEFEVVRKTYDWDDNFNKIEKTDTITRKMPEILFMLGVGNKKNVNKLIALLESTKILEKKENFYSVDVKGNKIPVFLRIYNDILFISNNEKYIKNPKVYSKTEQLSKQHSKMFKKNFFVAYANTATVSRYFADSEISFNEKKMLIAASNTIKHITLTGNKKNKYMNSKYFIKLSETEDNSIKDIIIFMNKLYLLNGKKI